MEMTWVTRYVFTGERPGEEHFAPTGTRAAGGIVWVAWQSYRRSQEGILARRVTADGADPIEEVAPVAGLHHAPHSGMAGDVPVVAWLRGVPGAPASALAGVSAPRFQVVAAARRESGWAAPVAVPADGDGAAGTDASALHAASDGRQLWVVWCEATAPRTYAVRLAAFDGVTWTKPVQIATGWVQRPVVAPAAGGCWVAWDAYDGAQFAIWASFVGHDGSVSSPECAGALAATDGLVTPDAWQLIPSACVDADGQAWLAWVCSQDVVNDGGVMDQWPTVRVARHSGSGWDLVRDNAGSADLAQLAMGLLSYDDQAVWGYFGRRRRPQLLSDPEHGVWLLWERKEPQDAAAGVARGTLCARRITPPAARSGESAAVAQAVAAAASPRGYVPITIEGANDGAGSNPRLWCAARVDSEWSQTDLCLMRLDLAAASPLPDKGDWHNWRPVTLRESQSGPRPTVRVGGEALQLYWADMHVHSIISPQDEGYLDELYAYARGKAGLDVVAFTDNDRYYAAMPESDYATAMAFVAHFHEEDRMVLLPAFEWTYRAPSGPNHRTVIGRDETLPMLRHSEVDGDPAPHITAHAERHNALLHLHHETWELTDSRAEMNVEICSNWHVHMLDAGYREKLHAVLQSGRRLGFVGNGDNHRRCPGLAGALTGIWARELTRPAILDALRAHRCFATNGSRIAVQLWAGNTFMGGETASGGAPELRWEVGCTAPPARVTLCRDGEPIQTWDVAEPRGGATFLDSAAGPGEHFYYLAVEQTGAWRQYPATLAVAKGPRAWSSPVWVRRG